MNKGNDKQTCQFFDGVRGDLACNRETVDGETVCATHLPAYQGVTADD